ncbi:site-specific integrase [Leptolyngbya sp. FACHB-402]|nr:site-specific integrase [Leptolyngbya sp. FACHB-239]MBD2403727.1 site-specific integrase [Leptolyngbya sp. FACHB-402]
MTSRINENDRLLSEWLEQYRETTSTFYSYRTAGELFTRFLGDRSITEIQPEDVERFVQELEGDSKLAFNSLRSYKAAIRSFLKYISARPDLLHPLSIAHPPRRKLPDLYIDLRLNEVMQKEDNARNRVLLWLTIVVRCTTTEVLGLRWQDVDPQERCLVLRDHTLPESQDKEPRKAFLCNPIWSELIALRKGRSLDEHVFHGTRGTRLAPAQLNQIIVQALHRVGIDATPRDVCFSVKGKDRDYHLASWTEVQSPSYSQLPPYYAPRTASIQVGGTEVLRIENGKLLDANRPWAAQNLTNVAMFWDDEPVYVVEANLVTLNRLRIITNAYGLSILQ